MTRCPTCKLAMEAHSTSELLECCMKQAGAGFEDDSRGICPNCRHEISAHSDSQLAECTIDFLKSPANG